MAVLGVLAVLLAPTTAQAQPVEEKPNAPKDAPQAPDFGPPVLYETADDIHASQGRIYSANIPGVNPEQGEAYDRAFSALLPVVDDVYTTDPEHYRGVDVSEDMTRPFTATFHFAGKPNDRAVAAVKAGGYDIVSGGVMSLDDLVEVQKAVLDAAQKAFGEGSHIAVGTGMNGDVMLVEVDPDTSDRSPSDARAEIVREASKSYDGPTDIGSVVAVVSAQLNAEPNALNGGSMLGYRNSTGAAVKCTGGFGVQEYVTGKRGIMSAGHCDNTTQLNRVWELCPGTGTTCYEYTVHTPTTGDWDSTGGIVNSWAGDMAWWQSPNTSLVTDDFYASWTILHDNAVVPTYAQYALGGWRCRFGRTSGGGCSTVQATNQCQTFASGNNYCNMTKMGQTGATGGDSGGPWYAGAVGWGIHSGTNGIHDWYSNLATDNYYHVVVMT